MIELPEGYELIAEAGTSMAVHAGYRDRLLALGIRDPERLLREAEACPAPAGRGAVPAFALGGNRSGRDLCPFPVTPP